MNDVEREAIILKSAWEMADGMVNWAMFVKNDASAPTNLMFQTRTHATLFVILLGDFLSDIRAFKKEPIPLGLKAAPSNARPSDLTFLFHLRQVYTDPKLGSDTTALTAAVEEFARWLEGEFVAEQVNLHSIDVVANLRVPRYRYLKMCGDIAKHNLARLATNVGHLRKMLETSGRPVSEPQAYLALENFFDWFHEDIFVYHSSQIAEFLNNIRWAIYDYLRPEFKRSWHMTDSSNTDLPLYSYAVPEEITEPVAIAMYWDIMNRSRSGPYVQRFEVSPSFKQHY